MAKVPQQQSKVKAVSSSRDAVIQFKASRGTILLLVVLPALLLFGAGFLGFAVGIRSEPTPLAGPSPMPDTNSAAVALRNGPWGALEMQPITLQIPDECLTAITNQVSAGPRWVFKGYARHRVLALFASAGLADEEQRALSDTNCWQCSPNCVVVTPPRAAVLALSASARAIIYSALGQFPENPMQHSPFFWKTQEEREFFARAGFSEPVRELVQQLAYQKGNLTLLADWEVLLQALPPGPANSSRILKQLSSKPAVMAKLHLTPETDLNATIRYWGVGGLTKFTAPVLEAVTRIPQGRAVGVMAVLPTFARLRLNTYPCTSDNDGLDGCWTAFNFFNENPEPAVKDSAQWSRRINTDYFNVFADPRYGDIVVVSRPNGEVVQAGVYLADDLVFTRLGPTRWEPWCVMKVDDLREVSAIRLAHQEAPAVSYYRNRIF